MRYSVFSAKDIPTLGINSIGYAKNPKVTRFGPTRRNEYIIHYILSGKGIYNGYVVAENQGFLTTPQSFEEYYPDENDPWEFLWIIADDPRMEEYFSHMDADPRTNIFSYDFAHKLQDVKHFLISNNLKILNAAHISELFFFIFRLHLEKNDATAQKTAAETYVNFAVNYIKTNYHRQITVAELTGALGVSQPYLFRIFKSAFGKSPKSFITDYRIDLAKQLLSSSSLLISQIAASVGFEDALAFSRAFSKKAHCSPSDFRKNH